MKWMGLVVLKDAFFTSHLPAEAILAAVDSANFTLPARTPCHSFFETLQAKEFIQELLAMWKPFFKQRLRVWSEQPENI
jgi:hypothetical protein